MLDIRKELRTHFLDVWDRMSASEQETAIGLYRLGWNGCQVHYMNGLNGSQVDMIGRTAYCDAINYKAPIEK